MHCRRLLMTLSLKIKPDWSKYYNVNRLFSLDGISFYVIIGGRGIGKTTGFNIHNLLDYMGNGREFVYVRRYITELKKTKSMLEPIANGIRVQGLTNGAFQWEHEKTRIGYGLALTGQQTFKSGMNFSNVNTFIYDECILARGGAYRYLSNEVEMLFELISTVFRDRKGYRVFLLGNNADMFNPYFEYFKVPKFERSYKDPSRGLYCELASNSPALLEAEMETPLYKLTQGTQYGEYHYNNKVLINTHVVVGEKRPTDQLIGRLVYNTVTMNIYRRGIDFVFIERREKVIKDKYSYVIMEHGEQNYMYVRELRSSDLFRFVEACYFTDAAVFDDEKTGAIFAEVMELL